MAFPLKKPNSLTLKNILIFQFKKPFSHFKKYFDFPLKNSISHKKKKKKNK